MKGEKRCVSGCKGLPEEICTKSPRCTYFNGKRTYCRLSHKYKMKRPECNIKLRMTKKNKEDVARARLKEFFYKRKGRPMEELDAMNYKTPSASPLLSSSISPLTSESRSPSPSVNSFLSEELKRLMSAEARPSRSRTRTRGTRRRRTRAPSR